MRIPALRLGKRSRRAAAFAAVIAATALVMPSQAAPRAEPLTVPPNVLSATASGVRPDTLPDSEGYTFAGAVTSTQGIVVNRSKMWLTLDESTPIPGVLQYGRWNFPLDNPTQYSASNSVVPWPFEEVPCATAPVEDYRAQYVLNNLNFFSATQDGRFEELGLMPDMRVNLLAFGSVPATATIHTEMVRRDGVVVPWTSHVWNPSNLIPGCSGGESASYYRALIEGQVVISISDLEVDGVPVDLGPSCRTERPVDIRLWGEQGYIALSDAGYLGQYEGLPRIDGVPLEGTRMPLDSPLYFEHNGKSFPDPAGVVIPPFTGCGSGGDDLSPMVTAMASGSDNPLRASQTEPVKTVPIDPENVFKCGLIGECPLPGPETPPMPPLPWEVN